MRAQVRTRRIAALRSAFASESGPKPKVGNFPLLMIDLTRLPDARFLREGASNAGFLHFVHLVIDARSQKQNSTISITKSTGAIVERVCCRRHSVTRSNVDLLGDQSHRLPLNDDGSRC